MSGEEDPSESGVSVSTIMLISLRTKGLFSSEVRFREAGVMVKVEERSSAMMGRWRSARLSEEKSKVD